MADVLTITQRSYNMSRIKSGNTAPELRLQELLVSEGFGNFETHPKSVPGRPDFYFSNHKSAIFVDGCFWHACKDCYKAPQTNEEFWKMKIGTNVQRDETVNKKLNDLGIAVIRVKEHELKKDAALVMQNIGKELSKRVQPRVLDLFAGAGGLSEGFIRAGCEMVGHIEMEKNSCSTLLTRMIYHALRKKGELEDYKKYITGRITREKLIEKYGLQKERDSVICAAIGKDNYGDLIEQVRTRLNGKSLDIIVGGPPCQAYSYIGRARDIKKMRTDERNFLYKYYIEFLKALKPKIFVFENVPGLLSAGEGRYLLHMRQLMLSAGYATDYRILNAADYGVPQNRKRVILVGWRKDSNLKSYPEFPVVNREYKVKDFFSDLPKIKSGGGKPIKKFSRKNKLLQDLGIRNPDFEFLMDHITRPHTDRDLEIYHLAVLAKQKGENIKYNTLPERLKTHNNEISFLDRFKVVDADAPGSHTVVAHIAKDGHFYIHPDLKQNRSLSVREAARLQTFPDDYKFEGERGPQLKQIGNAVPPILSEIIAKELIKHL
ncbi:MAG: Cytosine-specific methyltransferase [Microgenomates group bacterium GW2011_GWC1_41_8]|uniref:Cytosine-specific methyltransferase n=1 Tax=Candidatus Roizmanbacteria bacterium GW2011_GWA1_41_13 TaxID=1618474 RepID=A0A0G0XTR2_9BACT|nr:MAG: Cytosine-specific methyltransferase [Candidatus Roizmanbacteria bacterium GW2011_GWA1_41_13]KKS22810.1 MAG: Cytosine-specific methyltransferase [Microgenomates group bacterium GW2011_GWC1_41_8]